MMWWMTERQPGHGTSSGLTESRPVESAVDRAFHEFAAPIAVGKACPDAAPRSLDDAHEVLGAAGAQELMRSSLVPELSQRQSGLERIARALA
jgi:hypothetical protein